MTAAVPTIAVEPPRAVPAGAFGGPRAERAAEIFAAMQDRHVPVTPALAVALATMEAAPRPADIEPFGRAYERAGAAIGLKGSVGRSRAWAPTAAAFRQHIAEPLLRRAALSVGEVRLVGMSALGGSAATGSYLAYCARIEAEIARLLTDTEEMGPGFWVPAAIALFGAMRRERERRSRNRERMPCSPATALARLAYEIEPDFGDAPELTRRLVRPRSRAELVRVGLRPREGGVEGIMHSRRVEDIADALHSEYLVPRSYRLLKFLEDGFNLLHRPPLRSPARDLLALGYCQQACDSGPAVLVKAAWLDATLRLRHALSAMHLNRSELGWCDLPAGGVRATALSVATDPGRFRGDPMRLPNVRKITQLSESALMPGIFERMPRGYVDLPDPAEPGGAVAAGRAAGGALRQACADAAHRAPERRDRDRAPDQAGAGEPGSYAAVFALQIAPAVSDRGASIEVNWTEQRQRIRTWLDLGSARTLRCAAIMLPDSLTRGAAFEMFADGHQATPLTLPQDEENPRAALARGLGMLSHWIMQRTLEAVHG